jgi:hypothetical protein
MTVETKTSSQEIKPTEIVIPISPLPRVRIRISLVTVLFGFLVFFIGAKPSWFGLDRSPVVGFIQISVMLVGLAIICVGGYGAIRALWRKQPLTISADIGLRLVSTGYVVTLFSGMADIFGIGSHPLPGTPIFGVWQARGMEIGLALIAIGFVMMFPYKKRG